MTYNWTYTVGKLEANENEFFERVNPGYICTGETLEERYEETEGREAGATTYVVMKSKGKRWTPYGMCRDCGDHYIIARWSRYDRIDKGTFKRTIDVEDR